MSFKGLLNQTCKILKLTETQNTTTGQKVKSWGTAYSGVKCRLDQATGREFAAADSIYASATHRLFLEKKYTLDEKENKIKVGKKTFNLLLVSDGGGHGHHLELLLEVIG